MERKICNLQFISFFLCLSSSSDFPHSSILLRLDRLPMPFFPFVQLNINKCLKCLVREILRLLLCHLSATQIENKYISCRSCSFFRQTKRIFHFRKNLKFSAKISYYKLLHAQTANVTIWHLSNDRVSKKVWNLIFFFIFFVFKIWIRMMIETANMRWRLIHFSFLVLLTFDVWLIENEKSSWRVLILLSFFMYTSTFLST